MEDEETLMLVDAETGIIINDPFKKSSEIYYIYDTEITGLDMDDWNYIKREGKNNKK